MTKTKQPVIWEVWQGGTLVCSRQMKLTERAARNKVENERRLGYFMEARPVPASPRVSDPEEP